MVKQTPGRPRRIVIVAPPRVTLQDLTGPYEVFCRAARKVAGAYEIQVASFGPGVRVATKFGLPVVCDLPIAKVRLPVDTLVIAGSECAVSDPPNARFLAWLRKASIGARRTASVCVGSFHLGQAGLLDGHRATTHWDYIGQLRQRYPQALVEEHPIYTRDRAIYTSAGVTAGIDLALALVEEDCGVAVAQRVARELVVFMQRPAHQPQLSVTLAQRMSDRDPIRHVQDWAPEHLDLVHGVDDLARQASMSPRHFSRLFRQETGTTPAAWLRALRAEMARRRLGEGSEPVARVAHRAGFGSERSLRRSIQSSEGVSPSLYRRRVQSGKGKTS